MTEHILKNSEDCGCDGMSGKCPVCDWGLGVCKICGLAECQLDERPDCPGPPENGTLGLVLVHALEPSVNDTGEKS